MSKRRDKARGLRKAKKPKNACGIDVHDYQLVCKIIDETGKMVDGVFENDVPGHLQLISWIRDNGCKLAGMEATGVYWKALYANLVHYRIVVGVANPEFVQGIPGKKTDRIDAERLARYTLDGYLPISIVPDQEINDLRNLTRMRDRMVREQTRTKNRISSLVARSGFRLRLSDKFGTAGMAIMMEIAKGKPIEEIFTKKRCKRMGLESSEEVLKRLDQLITPSTRRELELLIDALNQIRDRIAKFENAIDSSIGGNSRFKAQVDLIKSVPGFADTAAAIVLSETAGFDRFPSVERYAGYVGVVPEIDQSGTRQKDGIPVKKQCLSRVRTRCNKHLKWIYLIAAQSIVMTPDRPVVAGLKRFYNRILRTHKGRFGKQQALMALAHKLVKIVYAVIKSKTPYLGEEGSRKMMPRRRRSDHGVKETERVILKEVCEALNGLVTADHSRIAQVLQVT